MAPGASGRPIWAVCRSSEDLEVPEHLLDCCPPLRRTGIAARGAVTIVSCSEREPVQFPDVRDPARARAEAVARIDVCTDVAMRAGQLGAMRW
jgi:hypothetical protein